MARPRRQSVVTRRQQAEPLPASIPYHLLFSYGGGSRLVAGVNDGVVTLQSELDPRAQEQAVKIHGFDESHAGILTSPRVTTVVNGLLVAATD